MASDLESNSNPRRNAGGQDLPRRMPSSAALNEQSAITCWTPEPKSKGYGDALTDNENGKRYSNEPRPTENERSDNAREKKCQPETRPNDEPRFGVKAPGDGLLNSVHWI